MTAALARRPFAVWYEHLAGMNPALSRSLEARLAQAALLDSAALA
jgi:hypothetical protein